MAQLPQEQKAKIAEQVASFQEEKSKLDAEVSKWDDSGNDIIVLAKQMCMIMMEMTDFTRWGFLICAHSELAGLLGFQWDTVQVLLRALLLVISFKWCPVTACIWTGEMRYCAVAGW